MQIDKCFIKPYTCGGTDNAPLVKADKILLVKLDHIGDFVTSLPAISLIRHKYPQAKITLLVGTWNLSLAKRIREVDDVITFDFFNRKSELGIKSHTLKDIDFLISSLRKRRFDLGIDLRVHPETRGVLISSEVKCAVGYYTGELSIDKELSIGLRMNNGLSSKLAPHISVQILRLINALGQGVESSAPLSRINFNQADNDKLMKKYETLLGKPLLIGINPGVGSTIRQWPSSYYAELINKFIDNSDAHVIIFGSPSEEDIAEEVYAGVKCNERLTNLAGKLNISDFALFTKYCHLFIGNNSGSGHISGLMDTPTIIIFSGQVQPSEWHPFGWNTYTVTHPTDCSPCSLGHKQQCTHAMSCLTSIEPQYVYEKGVEIIRERNSKT